MEKKIKEPKKAKKLTLKQKLVYISMLLIHVERDMTGSIDGKTYKYASLPAIRKALDKPLKDVKLGYRFSTYSGGNEGVVLRLDIYDLEDFDTEYFNEMFIPNVIGANQNIYHTVGSGLTYYKKYMLATEFNLDIENDVDANVKQIKKIIVKEGSKDFDKVVEMIKNGASGEDIKEHYIIPPLVGKVLNNIKYEA